MKIDMNKKYRTKSGNNVRILCVDREGLFPVVALVKYSATEDIEAYTAEGTGFLNTASIHDLVEVSPYDDFKIDDKVLVSNDGKRWFKRHFAGVTPLGDPTAFVYGTTSFTADSMTEDDEGDKVIYYNYCKKYEPTNI